MNKTTVVHCRKLEYNVFIGRPSKWGNPFIIGRDGSRQEVIDKYREWIKDQEYLLSSLHEIKDQRLGCFCSPLPCHGEVLVELADKETPE